MSTSALPLNETFGPTFQGEGPHAGRRCWFVRLGMCNLACDWCDTPETWDRDQYDLKAENPVVEPDSIHHALAELGAEAGSMVVLTGGEPLIHHRHLAALLGSSQEWHVETNGTIRPPTYWDAVVTHTTVSPKVNTSDPLHRRIRPDVLEEWADVARAGRACFKFVAAGPWDVDGIAVLVKELGIPTEHVWVMPEGTTPGAVITTHRHIEPAITAHGFATTTRLHTLLWGNEKGR